MATPIDYINAIGALIKNTASDVYTGSENSKKLVTAYGEYVSAEQKGAPAAADKKASIMDFESWAKGEGAAKLVSEEKITPQEIKEATDYINNDGTVKDAKNSVFKDGKMIYEATTNAMGNNRWGMAGALIAGVLAYFLELGPIGMLLSAVIGSVAGSFFGDQQDGYMNTAFGVKMPERDKKPEAGQANEQAPAAGKTEEKAADADKSTANEPSRDPQKLVAALTKGTDQTIGGIPNKLRETGSPGLGA